MMDTHRPELGQEPHEHHSTEGLLDRETLEDRSPDLDPVDRTEALNYCLDDLYHLCNVRKVLKNEALVVQAIMVNVEYMELEIVL